MMVAQAPRMPAVQSRGALALILFSELFHGGCATVEERVVVAPYEREVIVHRAHLVGDDWLEVAARETEVGAEIKVADVAFCRDDLVVTRGIEVTTQRTTSSRAKKTEWALFGSFVGLTLAMAALREKSECAPQAVMCLGAGMAGVGAVTFMGAGIVSGAVLLADGLRAMDTLEEKEVSTSREQRNQVCKRWPIMGMRVNAAIGHARASATSDAGGEALLDFGPIPRKAGETAMTLTLDGVLLGNAVLSSEWRSVHLRDQRGRVGRGKSSR